MSLVWGVCPEVQTFYDLNQSIVIKQYFNRVVLNARGIHFFIGHLETVRLLLK